MLMVSSSVRMVDGVHSNTTSAGPVVTLGLELVVRTAGLEQRLVDPSTTSDDTNGSASVTRDGLFGTRGETNAGLVVVGAVADNGGVVARGAGKSTTVADLFFNVADNGTFRASGDGENVANVEGCLFAAVDEGAGVHALGGDEGFRTELVPVGIPEDDTSEGGATTGVVDDVLHDTTNVTIALGKVEVTQTGGVLVVVGVRFEDGMGAPLCPNNPTHGRCCSLS